MHQKVRNFWTKIVISTLTVCQLELGLYEFYPQVWCSTMGVSHTLLIDTAMWNVDFSVIEFISYDDAGIKRQSKVSRYWFFRQQKRYVFVCIVDDKELAQKICVTTLVKIQIRDTIISRTLPNFLTFLIWKNNFQCQLRPSTKLYPLNWPVSGLHKSITLSQDNAFRICLNKPC